MPVRLRIPRSPTTTRVTTHAPPTTCHPPPGSVHYLSKHPPPSSNAHRPSPRVFPFPPPRTARIRRIPSPLPMLTPPPLPAPGHPAKQPPNPPRPPCNPCPRSLPFPLSFLRPLPSTPPTPHSPNVRRRPAEKSGPSCLWPARPQRGRAGQRQLPLHPHHPEGCSFTSPGGEADPVPSPPSAIGVPAGLQREVPPPHPSPQPTLLGTTPDPPKMHPAPPQEFFRKNSYCARGHPSRPLHQPFASCSVTMPAHDPA